MRRRRWSASCGLEKWSRLAEREHGLCEDELQVLCPWGEGDLEDDSEQWWLGALLRNREDDWRPRDDRRDCRWDAGDRRCGDKDGCPATLLVMPASKRPTRGAGLSLDQRWWTTATWYRWAGSPKKTSPKRLCATFRWTGPTGNMATAKPWVFGGRRQASGRGIGVRRHLEVPDPGPMSVSRRPLAGSTALTDAVVCLFWSGLTLSPWRLSVVRGTQLPQRIGAHVLGRNSGTHGWLRLAEREHGLCEDELQVLCPWGEGDLEDDSEQWWLGALLRNGEDDWRPRDDRRDCRWDAGDCRCGDKDGCPATLLVMPALKRPTRGAGLSLDQRWWTTATWYRWAGSPKKTSPRRLCATFRWTGPTGNMATAKPWVFGRRRQASGRGIGVRWHLEVSDPGPMSVSRRPLAGSTALTDAVVCLFWSGLTLSPWRLSVVRGTQLPQRIGAHVLGRNSGTHGWLRWSVINKLIPVRPGWLGDMGRVTKKKLRESAGV